MDGLILVDKPAGCTSHDIVRKIKRKFNVKKVGHAGTLDPLATGLLIILVGQGTKMSDYLLTGEKGYEVKIRFGLTTDSLDITGQVQSETSTENLEVESIKESVFSLSGEVELPVPSFSAVKVDGKKMYEMAHKGEETPVIMRTWKFYDVKPLEIEKSFCRVSLKCSKGGYIRAWANELGRRLEVGGCVEELRRVLSAPFGLEIAMNIDEIEAFEGEIEEMPSFISLEEALPHLPSVSADTWESKMLLNGQVTRTLSAKILHDFGMIQVLSEADQKLIGLISNKREEGLKIARIFPL